jgi:chemotaxis protein MotB
MNRTRQLAIAGLGVAALLATGCETPGLKQQVQSLQEQNEQLRTERDSLQSQLESCMLDRQSLEDRVLDLQLRLSECQDQLEQGTAQPLRGGFQGTQEFAWLDVGDDVLFASGRHTLTSEGRAKVAEVLRIARSQFPDNQLWVVGHTDSDPIRVTKDRYEDNLDLSLNRAAAVFRELMNLGMSAEQMMAAGQGEFNPRASNETDQGKAQNRRVTFISVRAPDIVDR